MKSYKTLDINNVKREKLTLHQQKALVAMKSTRDAYKRGLWRI